jgi:exodeoxyribonuclease VII small subunit
VADRPDGLDVSEPGREPDGGPEGPLGYLVALGELDKILRELEDPTVDIDRLGERVRRASQLVALCRERITAARLEVEQVVAELDGPFDPA